MKNWKLFFAALFAVVVISCGGTESDAEEAGSSFNEMMDGNSLENQGPTKVVDCEKSSIEDWDNFIGISIGTNETDLDPIIGKFTGGEYTVDSAAFVYYFKRVEKAPITVWVNAKTGNVETVFVEVLGYADYFEGDVDDLAEEFDLKECDTKWFGMMPEDLIKEMGKPTTDEKKEDGVRSLLYDSEKYDISVSFKFYESQGGMCSSISVNWFY